MNRCHSKELGGLPRAGLELPLTQEDLELVILLPHTPKQLDYQDLFILFLNTADLA